MHERIGIIGPDTALGTRLIEHFHLARKADVIPICKDASSWAVNCRFNLPTMDFVPNDLRCLESAFGPCDTLIYCTDLGAPISTDIIENVYTAASKAGIYRLIFISTAFTLGAKPVQTSSEWNIKYFNQKHCKPWHMAEEKLLQLRAKHDMEVVILKPGFIYGPRTPIIIHFANSLIQDNAFWYKRGGGIFNGVYVDNVIEAIEKALVQSGDGQSFLLVDQEPLHWHQWMTPIIKAFGLHPNMLINYDETAEEKPKAFQINAWLERFSSKPETFFDLYESGMKCHWKLPQDKAIELLNYKPIVGFQEAIAKTIEWLRFAGYPVQTEVLPMPELVLHHNDY